MAKPVAVLSISLNTPTWAESAYATSRKAYCEKHDYADLRLTDGDLGFFLDADLSAWVRIPLMVWLAKHFDVLYLDNDIVVSDDCPGVADITDGRQAFFVVHGESGRPNSGMMITTGDTRVLEFAIRHRAETAPKAFAAPYENGHVIWGCAEHPYVELDRRFNNASDSDGYFIHHTGPNLGLRQITYTKASARPLNVYNVIPTRQGWRPAARTLLLGLDPRSPIPLANISDPTRNFGSLTNAVQLALQKKYEVLRHGDLQVL